MSLKFALLVFVVGSLGCLLRLLHLARTGQRDMSLNWVQDIDRREQGKGIDGVCWTWPEPKSAVLRAKGKL